MTGTLDSMRPWIAPSILIAMLVQGVSGVTWVNGIGNLARLNERDITRVETRVSVIEKFSIDSASRMAVLESQLRSMIVVLDRIDTRMEQRSDSRK